MTEVKRPRGRPKGSGATDDRAALAKVADKLIADPKLKPSTAMRRVIHQMHVPATKDTATLRRFQVKWKIDGEQFLADARNRVEKRRDVSRGSGGYYYGPTATDMLRAQALHAKHMVDGFGLASHYSMVDQVTEALRSPMAEALRKQDEIRRQMDLIDPPFTREVRAIIRQQEHERIMRLAYMY